LASGNLPHDKTTSDLINIMDNDQIMYVISAACDNCPIDRFLVTEACHFGAISDKIYIVNVTKELEE
jgi:hypothetical protein